MRKAFENLKKINSSYKAAVDALAAQYEAEAAGDSRYSDEVIAQRVAERNASFNGQIDGAAQRAAAAAAPEIAKLRAAVRAYATSTADAAKVQPPPGAPFGRGGTERGGTRSLCGWCQLCRFEAARKGQGYSEKNARMIGPELLGKTRISAAIQTV